MNVVISSSIPKSVLDGLRQPRPVDYKQVEVALGGGVVLEEMVKALFSHVQLRASFEGMKELPFTEVEFLAYHLALLKARIAYTLNQRVPEHLHPKSRTAVPAFFCDILANIGKAEIKSLGVILVPKFDNTQIADETLEAIFSDEDSIKHFKEISMFLKNMTRYGFVMSEGYSADRYGQEAFMAFQLVEDTLRRHDDSAHPGYAVMAAVVCKAQMLETLSPRVMYASLEEMKHAVTYLIEPRNLQ